jgi:hypothetical protein
MSIQLLKDQQKYINLCISVYEMIQKNVINKESVSLIIVNLPPILTQTYDQITCFCDILFGNGANGLFNRCG